MHVVQYPTLQEPCPSQISSKRKPPTLPPATALKTNGQATPMALTQALAGTLRSRPPPRPVIEERQALLTVNSICVMFAVTHEFVKLILYTLAGMSVTFTPGEKTEIAKNGTAGRS